MRHTRDVGVECSATYSLRCDVRCTAMTRSDSDVPRGGRSAEKTRIWKQDEGTGVDGAIQSGVYRKLRLKLADRQHHTLKLHSHRWRSWPERRSRDRTPRTASSNRTPNAWYRCAHPSAGRLHRSRGRLCSKKEDVKQVHSSAHQTRYRNGTA